VQGSYPIAARTGGLRQALRGKELLYFKKPLEPFMDSGAGVGTGRTAGQDRAHVGLRGI